MITFTVRGHFCRHVSHREALHDESGKIKKMAFLLILRALVLAVAGRLTHTTQN